MKKLNRYLPFVTLPLGLGLALNSAASARKVDQDTQEILGETRVLPEIMRNFAETKESVNAVLDKEDYLQGNLLLMQKNITDRATNFVDGYAEYERRKKTPVPFRLDWANDKKLIKSSEMVWPVFRPTDFGEFVRIDTTMDKPRSMAYDKWQMERFFSKAFPRGWNSNLDSFKQEPKRIVLPKDYATEGNMAAATRVISESEAPAEVEINYYQLPVSDRDSVNFTKVIAHEVCHANDFNAVQYIGVQERLDLVKGLIERVFAENRFKSGYVESIGEKGDDQKRINYRKVSEYFAEICANWFEGSGNLHYEDSMLIENWIALIDPDYDPASYKKAKEALLDSAEARDFEELARTLTPLQQELLRVDVEFDYLSQKNLKWDNEANALDQQLAVYEEFWAAKKKGQMLVFNLPYVLKPIRQIIKEAKDLDARKKALNVRKNILEQRRKVLQKETE